MAKCEMDIQIAGRSRIIGIEAAGQFAFFAMQVIPLVLLAKYFAPVGNGSGPWESSFAQAAYQHWLQWILLVPLVGAFLADVLLGKRVCLLVSCVLCALGLGLLACTGQFPQPHLTFLVGLVLVALGFAGIKPCTLALLGDQASIGGHECVSRAYHQLYFFAQVACYASLWMTPKMLENHGSQWSLVLPCLLLCLALAYFLLGWRRFKSLPTTDSGFFREIFSLSFIAKCLRCAPVIVCLVFFWAFSSHIETAWLRQAQQTNLKWIGFGHLPLQIGAIKPWLVICLIPALSLGIYPLLEKRRPIFPLWKMVCGMFLLAGALALMPILNRSLDADQFPAPWMQWLVIALLAAAEVMVVITALAWLYRNAPASMKSCAMALAIASIWAGDQFLLSIQKAMTVPSAAAQQWAAAHQAMPLAWQKSPRSVVLPGYSDDPQDDIIARGKSGVIHQLEIPGNSIYQEAANRIDAISRGGFPSNKNGQIMINELRDLWGNPLIYQRVHRDQAKIFSAGPDRQMGTQWDLGLVLNRKQVRWNAISAQPDAQITHQPISGGGGKRLLDMNEDRFLTIFLAAFAFVFLAYAQIIRSRLSQG